MGGTLGTFRQAAVRRSLRAGDPLRVRRLHGVARHRAVMGKTGTLSRASPRLCRAPDGERPSACGGRAIYGAGARASAQSDRGDEGAGFLHRRFGGEHGSPRPQAWRRADGGRSRGAQGRLGRATRAGLSRLHVARDSPQRPGHRGANGAGHPGGVRSRGATGRFRRQPASADRSGEARVCRRLRARFRRGHHARQKRGSPRQGIPAGPRPPDRHEEGEDAAARRARTRRHRLPHGRGRFRHDDFVHPVQLPGAGFGHRRRRDQHAEPRL